MNLTADLKEKAKRLLGGKNLTKKRMEKLLDELETLKSQPSVVASVDIHEKVTVEDVVIPLDDELQAKIDAPAESTELQIMRAELAQLRAKLEDVSKPRAAEEKDEAIGAGRLPVNPLPAGPLGYTGSAQVPRGVWIKSPLGPPVDMMICGCAECSPFRVAHYICISCKRGPISYIQHRPQGRKMWMAPGSVWGIVHEACSVVCWQRYMEAVGIREAPLARELPPIPAPPVEREGPGQPLDIAPMPLGSD